MEDLDVVNVTSDLAGASNNKLVGRGRRRWGRDGSAFGTRRRPRPLAVKMAAAEGKCTKSWPGRVHSVTQRRTGENRRRQQQRRQRVLCFERPRSSASVRGPPPSQPPTRAQNTVRVRSCGPMRSHSRSARALFSWQRNHRSKDITPKKCRRREEGRPAATDEPLSPSLRTAVSHRF